MNEMDSSGSSKMATSNDKIQVSMNGLRSLMAMPRLFLYSYLLFAVLVAISAFFGEDVINIFAIEYVLVFVFMALITGTYAYLRRGTITIYISAEGVWFDNDLVPWRDVRSIHYAGGPQDGIRIVIEFARCSKRLTREQFLDSEKNMFEIADEIERLGNICVDINPYLSKLR